MKPPTTRRRRRVPRHAAILRPAQYPRCKGVDAHESDAESAMAARLPAARYGQGVGLRIPRGRGAKPRRRPVSGPQSVSGVRAGHAGLDRRPQELRPAGRHRRSDARAERRAGGRIAQPQISARRVRGRWFRLAGVRRGRRTGRADAADQNSRGCLAHVAAGRPGRDRADRLFRHSGRRPAATGRHLRRVRGRGRDRLDRRTDRQAQGLSCDRNCRRPGKMRLADARGALRRGYRLQGGGRGRAAPGVVSRRHRSLFRQRGRRHSGRGPGPHRAERARRIVRRHLALQRDRAAPGAEELHESGDSTGAHGRFHRDRLRRPIRGRGPRDDRLDHERGSDVSGRRPGRVRERAAHVLAAVRG